MIRSFFAFAALALAIVTPCAVRSRTSIASVGVGAHGYDFIVGTWSCKNSLPAAMGGPSSMTLTVARAAVASALSYHETGTNFDTFFYLVYDPKVKAWNSPLAAADGSYGTEYAHGTGKTVTWAGPYFYAASHTSQPYRDIITVGTLSAFTDRGQSQMSGSWKTLYDYACKRS